MSNVLGPQLFMFAAIFAIFYFVLIRPQQQQRKKHEQSLLAVKKGDEIVTSGGIIGEIVHIRTATSDGAPTMEDRVTIKSGESRLVVHRGRIHQILSGSTDGAAARSTPTSSASS
jgi:preprotein translocase subunit YajC